MFVVSVACGYNPVYNHGNNPHMAINHTPLTLFCHPNKSGEVDSDLCSSILRNTAILWTFAKLRKPHKLKLDNHDFQ